MLLVAKFDDSGNLNLAAFSFSEKELYSVVNTMRNERITAEIIPLDPDSIGRTGIGLVVNAMDIPKLQRSLNVTFKKEGANAKVIFNQAKLNFDGKPNLSYRCSRIDTPPNSCETIYASDDSEAVFKCALLAGEKNWLGGVPTPGFCD